MDPVSSGRFGLRLTAVALAGLLMAGCAATPQTGAANADLVETANDPLEPVNRVVFDVNQAVDKAVIKPVAQGYRYVVPEFGRNRVTDFLSNLRSPVVLANDLLQGDLERARITLVRFLLNSTFGVLGIMDVAAPMGLPEHSEDFGQTFAVWGIGEGPYLVLPLLGPSNPRDTIGLVSEWYADPARIYMRGENIEWAKWARTGLTVVDSRERKLDVLDEVERSSLDLYSAVRSLYRQRRNAEITNNTGAVDAPAPGIDFDFEAEADADWPSTEQKN